MFKSTKAIIPKAVLPFILVISVVLNLVLGVSYFKNNKKQYFIVNRVVDGDTFETKDGKYIRLLGVNAPEEGKCGYLEARQELEKLILNKKISFYASAEDSFKRPVADVYNENGESINVLVVTSGWAAYDSSDSKDKENMKAAGEIARKGGIGVFSTLCSQKVNKANPKCSIKGNYNDSSTKRTYSFSGCSRYEITTVDLYLQDQWFCSEAEAVRAGFTKSENCYGKSFSTR